MGVFLCPIDNQLVMKFILFYLVKWKKILIFVYIKQQNNGKTNKKNLLGRKI